MHELSICQSLIDQLEGLAREEGAVGVARLEIDVGMLSGVEARQLASAFEIASVGTVAQNAELQMRAVEPRVLCLACGDEFDASINDLRCRRCETAPTRLLRGRELILARVELIMGSLSS